MVTDAFQASTMKHYILLLILCNASTLIQSITYDALSGTFDDINIVLTPNQFNASQCPEILDNIKVIFNFNLKESLTKTLLLGSFSTNIQYFE